MTTTTLDLAPVPFAAQLARFGDSPAIRGGSRTISYAELANLVATTAARLGPVRRLVALTASNDVDSLVAYLAALTGNHAIILLPADKPAALESLVAAYDPDVIMRSGSGEPVLEERRPGTRHELHRELALLLSTSGSTGSPKLVRLSLENLQSNAESIAEYLGIGPHDRAATTLPMSYCYGLSVINSHLLRGASLVVTDLSVVDPCFWNLFHAEGATSFAAVPYTFELLKRVGFADMDLPSLRYVTQAGGRLNPDNVRDYAGLGARRGWDLVVMYGQTEATARMAYLPPDLAAEHPQAIGVPVPGGTFRLEHVPGLEESELIYAGPNVMLGYAESPQDLALGRTVAELRTGDLAKRTPNGLYEIVGRRSRFIKVVGLRVDLGHVERILSGLGVCAAVAGTDGQLVAAVEGDHDLALIAKTVAHDLGLPRAAVDLHPVPEIPRLANGKPDYPAIIAMASRPEMPANEPPPPHAGTDVRTIFAEVLETANVTDTDTFVSLGGDSLSYVAASVRLEQELGYLPRGWHLMPIRELTPGLKQAERAGHTAKPIHGRVRTWQRRLLAPMETSVVLRAVAIVFIVSTHIGLFSWEGTAHVLMAVAGYNFARFQLEGNRHSRFRRHLRAIARIVVPSVAVIAVAFAVTDDYGWHNVLLLNSLVGPQGWTDMSRFWFVEVLVHILLGLALLLAIPAVDRAMRRWPWAFPLSLAGLDLLQRFDVVELPYPGQGPALWLFAFGWAAAVSHTLRQRILLTAVALCTIPGSFEDTYRSATILAGFLVLLWINTLPVPRGMHRFVALLASASLYIYVTHWLVYPMVIQIDKGLAVWASLAVGVAYWALTSRVMGAAEGWLRPARPTAVERPDSLS